MLDGMALQNGGTIQQPNVCEYCQVVFHPGHACKQLEKGFHQGEKYFNHEEMK